MSRLWTSYNRLLDSQPLFTKAMTSLMGFTAGDVLAQKFVSEADEPYDFMRTLRLGSFGFFIHGTTGHYFYGMLDSKLPGESRERSMLLGLHGEERDAFNDESF